MKAVIGVTLNAQICGACLETFDENECVGWKCRACAKARRPLDPTFVYARPQRAHVCFLNGRPIGIGSTEQECWESAERWIERVHPEHITDYGTAWPRDAAMWRDRYRLLGGGVRYRIIAVRLEATALWALPGGTGSTLGDPAP